MTIEEAIKIANKVLDEERRRPTVRYSPKEPVFISGAPIAIPFQEKQIGKHPRTIWERSGSFRFQSENYDLLSGIYADLGGTDKSRFVSEVGARITDAHAYLNPENNPHGIGSGRNCTSELPLISEFLVRQRQTGLLLDHLLRTPVGPGLTLLLMQIEEMIALDFTLFSDSDYGEIRRIISAFRPQIDALNEQGHLSDVTESNTRFNLSRELPPLCLGIAAMCDKAEYLRLKVVRTSEPNAELLGDNKQVRSFLQKLRFSDMLVASLEEAERSYRQASTEFDYKACMTHLRSFLEKLHLEACEIVHLKCGGDLPANWGSGVSFLKKANVITVPEEQFVTSLYKLVSDAGVHPLTAEREYARLMRNMNIEYGLLFLARLDKWLANT